MVAGIFPGQAILLSRMMDVFTLEGEALKERGNFFASMFIVLAAGCLVFYFVLGWSVNVVAQVWNHLLDSHKETLIFPPDSLPQPPQADLQQHFTPGSSVLRPSRQQHGRSSEPGRLQSSVRV